METEEPRRKKKKRRDTGEIQHVKLGGINIPITPRDVTIIKWAVGIFIALAALMALVEDDTTEDDELYDETEVEAEDESGEYGDTDYEMDESDAAPAEEEYVDESETEPSEEEYVEESEEYPVEAHASASAEAYAE